LKPLVLASSSEIRKEIISRYDVPYICEDPLIDEDNLKLTYGSSDPKELSYFLAEAKAKSLSSKYKDHIILGCDQICIFDGKIFEKPSTILKANKNLKALSGSQHQLIGSYVFIKNDQLITKHETTCTLTMKKLTDEEISNYIDLDSPLNSCASYKFEANGYKLFSEVIGSLEEINGLPFKELRNIVNDHL
tara:strand:+ start:2146 stop:2718 length:573 start_codon:yes stop_codon:yes gene_type:complete